MFSVYGSWEPLDTQKILPRGVGTFSTIGQALPKIFAKKQCLLSIFQYRRRHKMFAALSRQIADFQGPAYIPKRAERPTYWKVLPPFFERIQESRVIAFSVGKRRKTPEISDLPKCGMSTMFFSKKTHF